MCNLEISGDLHRESHRINLLSLPLFSSPTQTVLYVGKKKPEDITTHCMEHPYDELTAYLIQASIEVYAPVSSQHNSNPIVGI